MKVRRKARDIQKKKVTLQVLGQLMGVQPTRYSVIIPERFIEMRATVIFHALCIVRCKFFNIQYIWSTRPAYLGSCGLSSVTLLSNTAE